MILALVWLEIVHQENFIMRIQFSIIFGIGAALSLASCSSSSSLPSTYTLNPTGSTNQITASGSSVNVGVQVVDASSSGVGNIKLSALSDARYCTVSPATATTDASGNAAFTVTTLGITGVNCTTGITVVGASASRATVNFATFVRPAQRGLSVPNSVVLPTGTATITDAGASASSITISSVANLPTPDSSHTYGVYLAKQDINGNVTGQTLLGKTAVLPPTAAFAGPVNLASSGYNVLEIALQSAGAGKLDVINSASLIGTFTPVAAGSANATLGVNADGLRVTTPFSLPSTANGQITLSNPNLNLGVAGDGISLAWTGLPQNPGGYSYIVFATDATAITTRLGSFSSNGRSGTFKFESQAPANGALPSSISDLKTKFDRVFVTLEPTSAGDGGTASSAPGALIVLDNASSAWTFNTTPTVDR
jgi:hypothetical protein